MKIKAIYNHPAYADSYTVYYDISYIRQNKRFYDCLCMSDKPFHPQGVCQHSSGQLGKHNGKKIAFSQLPNDCKNIIAYELKGY